MEKFLREKGFPIFGGKFYQIMSRDGNCFFGRHFVIVYPIFDFLLYFGSF